MINLDAITQVAKRCGVSEFINIVCKDIDIPLEVKMKLFKMAGEYKPEVNNGEKEDT